MDPNSLRILGLGEVGFESVNGQPYYEILNNWGRFAVMDSIQLRYPSTIFDESITGLTFSPIIEYLVIGLLVHPPETCKHTKVFHHFTLKVQSDCRGHFILPKMIEV
ncbi:sensory box/GGDEF domain/EAL domain-containing protein [Striga asiatica]|uniref:Sensory box/GGDEF domain/EAL domain-containing protein n=1 Tax=Striga asiatica TaxID=4170 RepID=A0A5A7Q0V0_STRAF|nr:sensory box/GGDEF domain/EAL domain-containing protein [Striga asiatica]